MAALAGGAAGGGIAAAFGGSAPTGTAAVHLAPSTNLAGQQTTNVATIAAQVDPAVVSVTSEAVVNVSNGFGGFGGSYQEQATLEGTGMIVTSSGEVITNNHVIEGARSISVNLDGSTKSYAAKLVGTDPTDDVALLQIEGVSGLPTVTFGNSSSIQVGDPVVAIGNALALGSSPTVTTGIISAENRTITAADGSGNSETLHGLFQTDAAINPGNSGGPLVDSAGRSHRDEHRRRRRRHGWHQLTEHRVHDPVQRNRRTPAVSRTRRERVVHDQLSRPGHYRVKQQSPELRVSCRRFGASVWNYNDLRHYEHPLVVPQLVQT